MEQNGNVPRVPRPAGGGAAARAGSSMPMPPGWSQEEPAEERIRRSASGNSTARPSRARFCTRLLQSQGRRPELRAGALARHLLVRVPLVVQAPRTDCHRPRRTRDCCQGQCAGRYRRRLRGGAAAHRHGRRPARLKLRLDAGADANHTHIYEGTSGKPDMLKPESWLRKVSYPSQGPL